MKCDRIWIIRILILNNIIMNSLTGSILIDFQNMPASEQQRNYHKQVYGAIKLQLSEMQKYQKTSHFIHCKKCNMVLTAEDRGSVYDWQQINSNKAQFKEVLQKCSEEQENAVVWICSYCENKNIIGCGELRFARNNSRVVHRGASQQQKKDPIMLIVFDVSGSMEEQLTNDQSLSSNLLERIKKTKIYQKIVAEEEREIQQLMQKQNIKVEGSDPKMKYKDYLKKNKLLMGLTESLITEISPSSANEKMERIGGFNSGASKKTKVSKTVGFVFFHSNVILDPATADKSPVVICDSQGGYAGKTENMTRERVNFDDFDSLFKLGATYGLDYTTKLNEFQFGNLEYKLGDYTHGQTALGPAIVLAAGVVSQHGAGSSIVVVTDGIGNKGIFDQSEKWEEPLRLLRDKLEKQKCFLAMLECRNINQMAKEKQIKTCMDEFCLKYQDSLAKKINILVDRNKTAQHLIEDVKKKMAASINRDHVIWTNQVLIRSQNPNVTFQEDMNRLTQKLHNQQQPYYIHPKIDYSKLKEKDYIHHFMTQAVIRYENTQTGEQSTFLTYILQKFIKFNSIRKQTLKKLDNEKTFHDMLEYLSQQQDNYDISNIPLGFVKKTFRDTLMFSKSICNRSLRFPLRPNDQPDEPSFYEEIFRKTEPKSIPEQNGEQAQNTL